MRSLLKADGATNVVAGGGPAIMERLPAAPVMPARSIGFNISPPAEQEPNAHSTTELAFRFHYIAMRKMHLAMRANALAVFPGGFGRLDELFESSTLQQTRKGSANADRAVWPRLLAPYRRFRRLVEDGMIAAEHLALLAFATTRKRAGRRCCNMASRCARERGLSAIGQERMRRRRIAKVAGVSREPPRPARFQVFHPQSGAACLAKDSDARLTRSPVEPYVACATSP